MTLENIILEHEKGITTIFINRPEKLNALNRATSQELHDTLKLVDENPEVQVIILTGIGEKAFVAGADISEFVGVDAEGGADIARSGQTTVFDLIEKSF